jgi:signal transduction histidine kinase
VSQRPAGHRECLACGQVDASTVPGLKVYSDGLCPASWQRLVSLRLQLRGVDQILSPGAGEARQELAAAATMVVEAIEDVRTVSRGIYPAIVSEGGLAPALEALSRASLLRMELDLDVETRLPPSVEVAAYYVVPEAMTNAAKHAQASVARLSAVDGRLCLIVSDDGTGGADPSRGSGLIGLTDRVEALGGTMTIVSPRHSGTTIQVELPSTALEQG